LILRATFKEEKDWFAGLNALFISGCVVAAFAILQHVSGGTSIPAPWDLELRATSFFGYPNAAGLFLAPLVSGAVVMTVARRTSAAIATILLGIPALYFCQTEAAYIAIPAGLFLAFLFSSISRKQKMLAAVAGIVCISFLFIASDRIHEKLTLSDTSGVTRKITWGETVGMLKDHPIFGAGLSGYPTVMEPYHTTGYYEIFQYPHNIILNIWSELGLLGLVAFLWLAIVVVKKMLWDHRHGSNKPVATAIHLIAFAALATMLVHGLVDVPYFKNDLSMMTWFFIAAMTI
jgi:putative inorganic carbon (hco3(-)) transporter